MKLLLVILTLLSFTSCHKMNLILNVNPPLKHWGGDSLPYVAPPITIKAPNK